MLRNKVGQLMKGHTLHKTIKENNPKKYEEWNKKISKTKKRLFKEGKLNPPSSCFTKGYKPWNKGLKRGKYIACLICGDKFYVHPNGIPRKYCSKKCYGKTVTEKNLKNNPTKNLETRRKISKSRTEKKYPKASETRKKLFKDGKLKSWNKGRTKETDERIKKQSQTINKLIKEGKIKILRGEESPHWRGGISFEPYGLGFNNKLKLQIRQRDNFTCQECNFTEEQLGYKLHIHHIDFDKQNNNPNNLISLCRSCHSQTHFNREDWIVYYQNKILERGFDGI